MFWYLDPLSLDSAMSSPDSHPDFHISFIARRMSPLLAAPKFCNSPPLPGLCFPSSVTSSLLENLPSPSTRLLPMVHGCSCLKRSSQSALAIRPVPLIAFSLHRPFLCESSGPPLAVLDEVQPRFLLLNLARRPGTLATLRS